MPTATASGESLQHLSLFVARSFRHHAYAPCPLLSVKCMFNGTAQYRADRAWFRVDQTGYLVLNDQQPYEICIDSPTLVESFIIFFQRGWAQEVLRCLVTPADRLLDEPGTSSGKSSPFFEAFASHNRFVSPALAALRRAHKGGALPDLWLEQELRGLLERILRAQGENFRLSDRLTAKRASTRQELWQRLNRARDFMRAQFQRSLTLAEIASVACLSPFHCLRGFQEAFHMTPHQFLSMCRVEHAKFLLQRSELPVTEICSAVGFESLGSFSSWFRRLVGVSPRQWRHQPKSNFEEVFKG